MSFSSVRGACGANGTVSCYVGDRHSSGKVPGLADAKKRGHGPATGRVALARSTPESNDVAYHYVRGDVRKRPGRFEDAAENAESTLWFEGAAGERLDGLPGADVVIVDPPRKGLDASLLTALAAAPPRRLVYLACGLPRLLEELPVLMGGGRMRLGGVEIFDFFPFTGHVETLVWLDRNGEHSASAPP